MASTEYTIDNKTGCPILDQITYPSVLGIDLALPEWEAILTAVVLSALIIITIVGNILVILSVFTCKRLRVAQNFFIVSLAAADLTVAIFVLPFNVVITVIGRWEFGSVVCKMWLTWDVLCCTASILNLCIIALDRYWAITDPLKYAQQRTLKRVLIMIGGVWILAGIISSPPLLGWNDWPGADGWTKDTPCVLTSEQGYNVYSALGSFFIPLIVMTFVYVEIYIATKRRLRGRAMATYMNMVRQNVGKPIPNNIALQPMDQPSDTTYNHDSLSDTKNRARYVSKKESTVTNEHEDNIGKQVCTSEKNNVKKSNQEPLLSVDDSITDDCGTPSVSFASPPERTEKSEMRNNSSPNLLQPTSSNKLPHALPATTGKTCSAFIDEKLRISLSRERRAARTLGIIMSVFIVCWLPFFILYVIPPNFVCGFDKLKNFITWLGYVNSGVNPIIYTIFSLDFRKSFKRLLHL